VTQAVFDTSAIVPAFTRHPCSDAAEAALRHYDPLLLTLVQAEFANAMRNLVKAKVIPPDDARDAISMLIAGFRFEALDNYLKEALALAVDYDHSVYDCLFVATAKVLKMPLITADRRLTRKFSALGGLVIVNLLDLPDPLP
jgi:predicted nucleic acid-binding protein